MTEYNFSELEDYLIKSGILPEPTNESFNNRYDSNNSLIATFNSISDVDQFFELYNHNNKYIYNNYDYLKLGQRIQINDGIHNKSWYIAGFDVESNKIASDGKSYDNGYGIMLIPETCIGYDQWNGAASAANGYYNHYIHTNVMNDVYNDLKTVLGTHIVNRRVLLSNSTNSNGSTNYTWTTAYCTLPSIGQLTGTFAKHNNKYDDGEANYKLPLFDYMDYKVNSYIVTRNIATESCFWFITSSGLKGNVGYSTYSYRPLIYIR